VTSYYFIVVFDLPCESKSTFSMYPNPDSLIEYSLSVTQKMFTSPARSITLTDMNEPTWIFFAQLLLRKQTTKRCFISPLHLVLLHYLAKIETQRLHIFS